MPYSDLWTLGDKDNNNVTFGRLAEDKLRGLKIGLLAGIPGFVCYILLILSRFGVIAGGFLRIYEWLNAPYILLIQGMTGNAGSTAEMAGWCLLPIALLTLLVPATCALGYYLGYREFSSRKNSCTARERKSAAAADRQPSAEFLAEFAEKTKKPLDKRGIIRYTG